MERDDGEEHEEEEKQIRQCHPKREESETYLHCETCGGGEN